MENKEWGPWIEHDGKGCPLALGVHFAIVFRLSGYMEGWVNEVVQRHPGWIASEYPADPVIRYRIRRPKALIEMIDMVEILPALKREPVQA